MLYQTAFLCTLVATVYSGLTKRSANTEITRTALGENIRLGTIFDARKSLMYSGFELFKDLEGISHAPNDDRTAEDVFIETSSESRTKDFEVGAVVQLEFMSGLIEVEGSGKYAVNDKDSESKVRVVLKRVTQAGYKDINLSGGEHGSPNAAYCNLVKGSSGPTHFVSRINYGRRVYMTFEKEVSKDEDSTSIAGKLMVDVKMIPHLNISGSVAVTIDGTEIKNDDSIVVKFYGDTILENFPATYVEAIDAYKATTVTKGEDGSNDLENSSPIKYYLTPIEEVCKDKTVNAINEITTSLITNAVARLQSLKNMMQKVNSLLMSTPAVRFAGIREPLVTFKIALEEFYSEISAKFTTEIPKVRSGEDESFFSQIIDDFTQSPFNGSRCDTFLGQREREINAIDILDNSLLVNDHIKLSDRVSANDNECIFKHKNATVFILYILPTENIAENFISGKYWNEPDSWVNDNEKKFELGFAKTRFGKYVEESLARSGDSKQTNCYMVKLDQISNYHDYETQLYSNGEQLTYTFVPPTVPDTPSCSVIHPNGFQLTTGKLINEDVTGIKVTVDWVDPSGSTLTSEQVLENADDITVSGLQGDTTYSIRTSYVVKYGHGEGKKSDAVSCTTLVTSEPFNVEFDGSDPYSPQVVWDRPLIVAEKYTNEAVTYTVSLEGTQLDKNPTALKQTFGAGELEAATKYEVTVTPAIDGKQGVPATKSFITAPPAPTWTKESVASHIAVFNVNLDSMDLPEEMAMESLLVSYGIISNEDGSPTEEEQFWHLPSSQISIDNLKSNTKYGVTIRLVVRVYGSLLYSGASSQLDVLTPSAGEESTLTETRRVFDEVQSFTKRKVDEYNSALEEVHKTLASATETGSSQVAALTVQLQDLTETVQEQSVGIQQRVSAFDRSNCIADGIAYTDEWNKILATTSSDTLSDCIDTCVNTTDCQSVSTLRDPDEELGTKCTLLRTRSLGNSMQKMKNALSVNLNCYVSSLVGTERCMEEGRSYTSSLQSSIIATIPSIQNVHECVAYCQQLDRCEGVTFMESRGCDTFSSRPAGTFDSNAGSVSVNMACLSANTHGLDACALPDTRLPNSLKLGSSTTSSTMEACVELCSKTDNCYMVAYNEDSSMCNLYATRDSKTLSSAPGWTSVNILCLGMQFQPVS